MTIILALAVLWDSIAIYPLKLLVVFLHEASHAVAAIMTGGSVEELVINAQEGGHIIRVGGNNFIIRSSGYLGSLVFGASLYLLSVKTRYDKPIMLLLGIFMVVITLFYGRSLFSFGFGISFGALMIASSWKAGETVNDAALRIIGLSNIMYVPMDIFTDTIEQGGYGSDAYLLAQDTFGSATMWGVIWLFASLAMIWYCLKWSFKAQRHQGNFID